MCIWRMYCALTPAHPTLLAGADRQAPDRVRRRHPDALIPGGNMGVSHLLITVVGQVVRMCADPVCFCDYVQPNADSRTSTTATIGSGQSILQYEASKNISPHARAACLLPHTALTP